MKLLASTGVAAALLAAFGMTCVPTTAAAQNYTWNTAKIGGTGYITGMYAHPRQAGLFYAKTDVGGAYRYNATTSTWIPLTDWLAPSVGYAKGIDSLALDPRDASKVYIMGGGGYNSGPALFMASSNQGQSFTTVQMPFSTGGNASGRQAGEKLQVDPNNSNILFYGTANAKVNAANNGLWKSTDGGQHWSRVTSFNVLTSDDTGAGVAFIAFSKDSTSVGNATPVIYVGVNTQSAADNGISVYKSGDGGNSWSRLWGGPTAGAFPQRGQMGPDGYLYITYSRAANYNDGNGNQYGPGGLVGGEVWKLNVQYGQDQWTNITPPGPWPAPYGYGFSGLSVDPTNKGWLTVNTIDWYASPGETMYRSTDGGATWTDVLAKSRLDPSLEPWRTSNGPITNFGNWGNSILDPNDMNHAFVSWAGGIWETHNLTASTTNWVFGENGVAETAILDLKSPVPNEWNAYPVLAGAGDVCGFTIMDVNTYPKFPIKGPDTCKDTWAIDFAKTNSKLVVRVGDDWASDNRKFGGVSYNGGYSWQAFGSNAATQSGGGYVAMSQDSRNPSNVVTSIIWSTWDAPTVRSTDMGNTWTNVALPKSVLLAADGADPTVFYAYDRPNGVIYLSNSNGANWWAATAPGVPTYADKLVTPTGVAGDLWLAGWNGLYHNNNWGLSAWEHLSTVTKAYALGFGKAAPGASYPTMYVSGIVGNVQGVFRSTDKGQTWVRIDTDQHQLGASTALTGDPKVFGTVYVSDGGRGVAVGTSTN